MKREEVLAELVESGSVWTIPPTDPPNHPLSRLPEDVRAAAALIDTDTGRTAHLPTEENWDGDGAHPTSGQARRVLEALSVVPTVKGGAQIELHAGGVDLEIEIEDDIIVMGCGIDGRPTGLPPRAPMILHEAVDSWAWYEHQET